MFGQVFTDTQGQINSVETMNDGLEGSFDGGYSPTTINRYVKVVRHSTCCDFKDIVGSLLIHEYFTESRQEGSGRTAEAIIEHTHIIDNSQ